MFVALTLSFIVTFLVLSISLVMASMVLQRINREQLEDSIADSDDQWPQLLRDDHLSSITVWQNVLERFNFSRILQEHISQADLHWSVGRITILMLLCGIVSLAVLLRLEWIPLWACFAVSGGAALLPYGYILRQRERRFRKFQEAFPDALDSMARSMRAGYPFAASLDIVSMEAAQPVGAEFKKTFAEGNLGMSWAQALGNLSNRVPLLEVNLFIAAVNLHARTGGRLSEVIAGLADNLRENTAFEGEVRSIAAHGKLTGLILTLIPVGIAGIMAVVSPGYIGILIENPIGRNLIAAAAICLVIAHFVIRKLVDIRV